MLKAVETGKAGCRTGRRSPFVRTQVTDGRDRKSCGGESRTLLAGDSPPVTQSNSLASLRLWRVWRCCVFGELWADRLAREGRVVRGKVRVPAGYVGAMVKAFCVAEGRS